VVLACNPSYVRGIDRRILAPRVGLGKNMRLYGKMSKAKKSMELGSSGK
jgi:hypothetical protein